MKRRTFSLLLIIILSLGLVQVITAQENDAGPPGPGGSECSQAENCEVLEDPENMGTLEVGDATTLTFKAGQDEFEVDILVDDPGEESCNGGYCVIYNEDGTVTWFIEDVEADTKDISHIQFWDFTDDADHDGVADADDNCPEHANADQLDSDADGIGDACDPDIDTDEDGVADFLDNCPDVANTDQLDSDADGIGDLCDTDDIDEDGVLDEVDNCIDVANADQLDSDGDGIGDVCDTDDEADAGALTTICHKEKKTKMKSGGALAAHLGHGDTLGACPATSSASGNGNGNGRGNDKDKKSKKSKKNK